MKQPTGSVVQMAFVVRDMRRSAEYFGKAFGAGPFFLLEHVPLANPNYRGRAVAPDFSVAIGFSGAMQIELIEQHCDTPSIYKEFLDAHGEGYHHVWRRVADFDKAKAEYEAMGWDAAWQVDSLGIGRCAYIDTHGQAGRYIEIMEFSPGLLKSWEEMERISDAWDGSDFFRPVPAF